MTRSSMPLVAVTTYRQPARWGPWHRDAAVLPTSYLDCVVAAGGRPLMVPPPSGAVDGELSAAAVVAAVDALVVAGGGDVDPACYGAPAHGATAGICPGRDASELALLRAALAADLPVLAICRGMQLLNVAMGGTLSQHLPEVVGDDGHQPRQGCFSEVEVVAVPGTHLGSIAPRATVLCSHHQAVDVLGAGLVVSARAGDGVVEALEMPDRRFVVAVQWHPEEANDVALFAALLAAARDVEPASERR